MAVFLTVQAFVNFSQGSNTVPSGMVMSPPYWEFLQASAPEPPVEPPADAGVKLGKGTAVEPPIVSAVSAGTTAPPSGVFVGVCIGVSLGTGVSVEVGGAAAAIWVNST